MIKKTYSLSDPRERSVAIAGKVEVTAVCYWRSGRKSSAQAQSDRVWLSVGEREEKLRKPHLWGLNI